MKVLSFFLLLALSSLSRSEARPFEECAEEKYRWWANSIVSEGNRQYDRSNRDGIRLMTDSLERLLQRWKDEGCLSYIDSLTYTADLLKLKADWHYENGNYDVRSFAEAERFLDEALCIYNSDSAFSYSLDCAPMIHREMAQLYYRTADYPKALEHISSALDAYTYACEEVGEIEEDDSVYLSIRGQRAICLARVGETEKALKMIEDLCVAFPSGSDGRWESVRKKGKILMLSGKEERKKEAYECYRQFFCWQKQTSLDMLSTMSDSERQDYWMRMRPFFADCYQLEDTDPGFLYDVVLFSKGLLLQLNRLSGRGMTSRKALASLCYTWKDVQGRLPENSVAIEFVQYEKAGKTQMAALVVNRKGAPEWISMMSPDEFMNYETWYRKNAERIYSTEGRLKDPLYNDSTLRTKIWNDTLLKAIGNAEKIYFAPDGYLHQVAVEYMWPDRSGEKELFRLTSTRRLMEEHHLDLDAALIVGGVDFRAHTAENSTGNDSTAYCYMQSCHANFEELPETLMESNRIAQVRANPRDTLLLSSAATESAFRSLCSRYSIVNISTHGYFGAATIPQGTDLKTCMSDESLSQSAVVLAGVNRSISTPYFDTEKMDGILSAREIAESDMANVRLAVVSACQTGLGFVTADGIFGIQRGLKNAGVSCIVVSLWSVSDIATSMLMSAFHANIEKGMPPHRAFMVARESLLSSVAGGNPGRRFNAATLSGEYVEVEHAIYDAPQYRNAFIMIDALE